MNIVICGYSGAGKDQLQKMLCENFKYNRLVPTTTRPKRDYEVEDVDYHFVTDEEFDDMRDNGKFFQYGTFNWQYGIENDELSKKNWVAVVNDADFDKLTYHRDVLKDIDFISILLTADEEERIKRQIVRGDDEEEIINRIIRDDDKWDELEYMFDYVVESEPKEWDTLVQALTCIADYCNK